MAWCVQLLFIVVLTVLTGVAPDIITPPSPVTVQYGQDFVLTCISNDTSQFMQWVSPQDVVFWDSISNSVLDPDKYERVGSGADYSIRVKDAEWTDAGPYHCETSGVGFNKYMTQVVVMKVPGVGVNYNYEENRVESNIRCQVYYAGESEANLNASHAPQLESFLDDAKLEPDSEDRRDGGYCSSLPCDSYYPSYIIHDTRGINLTYNAKDIIRCRAYTEDPAFEVERSIESVIDYSPRNLRIFPVKRVYYPGDIIVCAADGEPAPEIKWAHVIEGTAGFARWGPALGIEKDMEGENVWECSAWNDMISKPITQRISFLVANTTEMQTRIATESGQDVTLPCVLNDTSDSFQWFSPQNDVIWDSISDSVSNPSKYKRVGTGTDYSLMVRNATFSDAGPYRCQTIGADTYKAVRLMILELRQLIPSAIKENEDPWMICILRYTGDIYPNFVVPRMDAFIGDTKQEDCVGVGTIAQYGYCSSFPCDVSITSMEFISTDNLDVNYKGNPADNGKDFRCKVHIQDPPFELWRSVEMTVEYSPRNLTIIPDMPVYHVGEIINCTAEGEPEPDIKWAPVNGTWGSVINGSQLEILPNMTGENIWECVAWNKMVEDPITHQVAFIVLPDEPNRGHKDGPAAIWLGMAATLMISLAVS